MIRPLQPAHILIANNVYPPIMAGGAELIVAYLAEGLAARGHKVTVVSTCAPEMEPYADEHRNGVDVVRFFPKNVYWSFSRGERPGYEKALWHLRDAWNRDAARRFGRIVADRKPDLLHTHLIDGFSASIWRKAKRSGVPVLHTAHDYHLLCPRAVMLTKSLQICRNPTAGCRIYRGWHLKTARDVDLFCSPSQFLIDKHVEQGLAVPRVAKVANGIPLPVIELAGRPADGPRRFVFAARLTVEKGCAVVLDAIRAMPDDADYELSVAGRGPFEDQFKAEAARNPRVKFLGYIQGDQKDALFKASDCVLLPSLWYENAPVVIVEAAAYGMAVIGSRIGAIPEFVHDEKTGLLFQPGDGIGLAAAMMRLVREPALAGQFGQNASALAASSGVKQMVDAYEAEYAQLIGARAA